MLKKLSKYGNSTTLVIDKAILELLNMDESSMVKLATDGKSLIVTPVLKNTTEKVSYAPEEGFHAAIHATSSKQLEKMSDAHQEKFKDMAPAMQKDFKEAFDKHKNAMELFSKNYDSNEGFKVALTMLAEKYDPVSQSEDYVKELNKLKLQFFPELGELEKEIQAITLKYEALSKR